MPIDWLKGLSQAAQTHMYILDENKIIPRPHTLIGSRSLIVVSKKKKNHEVGDGECRTGHT